MGVPAQSCEHLYSSLLWLLPLEPQKSPRKPSPPLFQEVVAGLLEELRLLLVSSLIRLLSLEVESVAPSCAEDPSLPPTWLSQPVTAEMDNAVSKVMLHEDYDSWTIENDICLLELESQADFSSSVIGSISLPSSMEEYPAGTDCTVSGWGTTSEGGSLGKTLMKVTVPVVSDDDCRDAYGVSEIADSMICAGLEQGGKDSCQGGSGGPFMCGSQLSGVVSWGYGCAEPGYPGVYTQTSYFIDWLNSHM